MDELEHAKHLLWHAGDLRYKLWSQQEPIYNTIRGLPRYVDEAVVLCARQFGKCSVKTDTCATPKGPVEIGNLVVGQEIYGYNNAGKVEICRVVAKENVGVKTVIPLLSHGRTIATVTAEHRFLSTWKDSKTSPRRHAVLTTKQILSGRGRKIARVMIDAPLGEVSCRHAYAIGAMIGNGCGKQSGTRWYISSPDARVPMKVAETIGAAHCYKQHETNFTWVLSTTPKGEGTGNSVSSEILPIEHEAWFDGLYSHEKWIDREVVETWDRESCLELLAGLTDTDGSVFLQKDGTLRWSYSTGSKRLSGDVAWLVSRLFQREPGITEHARKDAVEFTVHVINNFFASRIVRSISPHMVMDHKRWINEYEGLAFRNTLPDAIGVEAGLEYEAECFDIQVDNDTNLYVLHNEGLITHNSHLGVILAVEDCIRYPNRCILIVGPTYDQTREIVTPRLRDVIRDAPPGLVRGLKSEKKWLIGDSELVIGGFDINSSSQRGKTVQTIYIEEVVDAKPDHFVESMQSDLGPALTHSDAGKMIYLTTLPKIPDHPFIVETMPRAELNEALKVYTIDDNKALTPEQYEACVRRAGGKDSDDFKREYLCQLIRDRNKVVIPDFSEARHVNAFDLPLYNKFEIFVDWGGVRDLTVALLTAFDFYRAKDLYIDEMVWDGNTPTQRIVKDLKAWQDKYDISRIICDAPGQLLVDLRATHGLETRLPNKSDWEASINQLAVRYAQDKVWIHPNCKLLIQTCRSGMFNDRKTDFERSSALGHCDAIAAQMYANRDMNRESPYPAQVMNRDHMFQRPQVDDTNRGVVTRSFTGGGMKKFGAFKR